MLPSPSQEWASSSGAGGALEKTSSANWSLPQNRIGPNPRAGSRFCRTYPVHLAHASTPDRHRLTPRHGSSGAGTDIRGDLRVKQHWRCDNPCLRRPSPCRRGRLRLLLLPRFDAFMRSAVPGSWDRGRHFDVSNFAADRPARCCHSRHRYRSVRGSRSASSSPPSDRLKLL